MDIQEKTKKEERRVHPFLFLLCLGVLVLITAYFWSSWQERMEETQISNIIRSDDIDVLLNNSGILPVVFQAEQPTILNQVLALEGEIKKLYSGADPATQAVSGQRTESIEFKDSLDPVDLALRDLVLLQGENGEESFRLHAVWATLRQSSSLLSMYKPRLLYTPRQENQDQQANEKIVGQTTEEITEGTTGESTAQMQGAETINVLTLLDQDKTNFKSALTARDSFEVDNPKIIAIDSDRGIVVENSKVYLKDNVFAKQDLNSIQGDTLNYDDDKKIATFPTTSFFQGESLKGNANTLNWHLEESKIYGSNGVVMEWTPSS